MNYTEMMQELETIALLMETETMASPRVGPLAQRLRRLMLKIEFVHKAPPVDYLSGPALDEWRSR